MLVAGLISCKYSNDNTQQANPTEKLETPTETKRNIDTLKEFKLADSFHLTHVKGDFYKGTSGHIYQRTFADQQAGGPDSLMKVEYFNGVLPQDIDPFTFKELDGFYAKDKNFAYYYRPTSGGMLIAKIEEADVKTFAVLQGHYKYAVDKKYVFKDGSIIDNLKSSTLQIERDSSGKIIKLISDTTLLVVD